MIDQIYRVNFLDRTSANLDSSTPMLRTLPIEQASGYYDLGESWVGFSQEASFTSPTLTDTSSFVTVTAVREPGFLNFARSTATETTVSDNFYTLTLSDSTSSLATGSSWASNGIIYDSRYVRVRADPIFDKKLDFKRKIKEQLAPAVTKNREGNIIRSLSSSSRFESVSVSELRALSLLKKMISKRQWITYLKYGLLEVQGVSGLRYIIRRDRSHVKVYKKGCLIAELCVAGAFDVPLTDRVITKKIIIECSELDIWKRANVYWRSSEVTFKKADIDDSAIQKLAA